jgi:hypothetical protein
LGRIHGGSDGMIIDTPEDQKRFRDAKELVSHGKQIERRLNELFPAFYKGSEAQAKFQKIFRDRMANLIKDESLLKGRFRITSVISN